jgi:hypothetical protein
MKDIKEGKVKGRGFGAKKKNLGWRCLDNSQKNKITYLREAN